MILVVAPFLFVMLGLFSERAQEWLRARRRWLIICAPAALVTLFCGAAAYSGALSIALAALVAGYVALATLLAFLRLDLAAILALWLPIELAAGASLVPKPVQGTLHAVAYGVAIALALTLFLLYRGWTDMKYRLPRRGDMLHAAIGLAVAIVVLAPVGLWVGFLSPAHPLRASWGTLALRILTIFVATALPEEILFRGLIQTWIRRRLGDNNWTVAVAGIVFGCSHLNNAPGPLPNWRYAIVATLAGWIFGKVFQKSNSIVASALVHTGVDAMKWAGF